MKFDGHEVAVLSSITGFYSIVNNCLGPGWIRGFIHRMPIAAFSVALGGVALALPFTVVPIRRAMKLPTNQYDPVHPKTVFPNYADITEWRRLQGE